jgi:LPS-assembly protein
MSKKIFLFLCYLFFLISGDLFSQELIVYAEKLEQIDKNTRVATGYVDIIYGEQHLQADKVVYRIKEKICQAEGNVVLFEPGFKIAGERMEMNLETKQGTFYNVVIYTKPEARVYAKEAKRIGDDKFRVKDAIFTICNQPNPNWSMKVKEATVHLDHYVKARSTTFRVKNVPILYFPYIYWPLNSERSTGFLLPEIGTSNLKGTVISNAFFWAIARNMDAIFSLDYYTKMGWGSGAEYRYILSRKSSGNVNFYFLKDKLRESKSYKLQINHDQTLPGGIRGSLRVNYLSDFQSLQNYEQNFNLNSQRTISSSGYLSWSKSYYSLTLLANNNTTYFPQGGKVTLRNLPKVNFRVRSTPLFGSPVYFSLSSQWDLPSKITEQVDEKNEFSLSRLDLQPQLSAPIKGIPWLKITPTLGVRGTMYSKSLGSDNALVDESILRSYYHFNLSITGPLFNRIFSSGSDEEGSKIKHLIEPRIDYQYISAATNQDQVPRFDGMDYTAEANELVYSLVNHFYIKSGKGNPREFLNISLSQHVSLSSDLYTTYGRQYNRFSTAYLEKPPSRLSPMMLTATFNPNPDYRVGARAEYDFSTGTLLNLGITGGIRKSDRFYTDLSYQKSMSKGEGRVTGNTLIANGGGRLLGERIDWNYTLNYDIYRSKLLLGGVGLRYNTQCVAFILGYKQFNYPGREERQFLFNIELKTVGSFGSSF